MRHRFASAVALAVTATACAAPTGAPGADAKPSPTTVAETPGPTPTRPAPPPSPSTVPTPDATTPTPAPVAPELTPVTVDDWRYGYAWTSFSTDVGGGQGEPYDKPGEVHVTFTVRMTATDDRRPEIPSPNSLWVGHNYGFSFFVKPSKFPDCLPLDGVGLCELSAGPFYAGCETLQNDGDGTGFPSGGSLVMSCRIDATFPASVKPADFKVAVRHDECCDTDTEHRTWLPFQNLPAPTPTPEEPEEPEAPEQDPVDPPVDQSPPPIRYL
ncbi:hypothetical protein ACFCZ6_12550 [Streptomyces hydrogenans]|uniref:hypothetical protein n=1 Tax=Streptomyces hydrogenans TaxID=1873719 RepID=UPI0035E14CC5